MCFILVRYGFYVGFVLLLCGSSLGFELGSMWILLGFDSFFVLFEFEFGLHLVSSLVLFGSDLGSIWGFSWLVFGFYLCSIRVLFGFYLSPIWI